MLGESTVGYSFWADPVCVWNVWPLASGELWTLLAGRSGMGPAVSLDKQVAEKIAKMQLP